MRAAIFERAHHAVAGRTGLAFNFVIENALGGGVTISLNQDVHGKSLSTVMLEIELPGAVN